MSTVYHLAPDAGHAVHPYTGELITLADASDVDLVALRDALTELDRDRRAAVDQADREIVRRTDAHYLAGHIDGYTYTVGDYKVEVPKKAPEVVETAAAAGLRDELLRRAIELDIPVDTIAAAFSVHYSALKRKLDTLAELRPAVAGIVADHAIVKPRKPKVTRYRPRALDATSTDEPSTPELAAAHHQEDPTP